MKSSLLLVFLIFSSACIQLSPSNPALNPFSPSFNPFGAFQQKTVHPAEGLQVSLDTQPNPVFAGSSAKIYFDAQNKDVSPIRNIFLEVFDTGNIVREERCSFDSQILLPDQIVSLTCSVRAPKEIIKKTQTETINARARFRSVLSAAQSLDVLSEERYKQELLAGNIRPKPRTYSYRDKNVELLVEFSEDMPIVFRKDKQYFVYFTIKNIGNGFMDKITFGENFLLIEQRNLQFSGFKDVKSVDLFLTFLEKLINEIKQKPQQEKEQIFCDEKNYLCCRDFKTIYPIGRTFPRIACELRLPQTEQLVDYQILIPLIYDYEVRTTTQLRVVR